MHNLFLLFVNRTRGYINNTSLRSLIAVVPQRIDLFAGNVIDIVAVGDDEPDIQKVIDISTQLGILSFIESLPNGFETYLGENGATLSGGQKQRIAIARALYRNPEILILDEVTSSLDAASEQFVDKAIADQRKNGYCYRPSIKYDNKCGKSNWFNHIKPSMVY